MDDIRATFSKKWAEVVNINPWFYATSTWTHSLFCFFFDDITILLCRPTKQTEGEFVDVFFVGSFSLMCKLLKGFIGRLIKWTSNM